MKRLIRIVMYLILIAVLPAAVFFGLPSEVPYTVTEQYAFTAGGSPDAEVSLAVMIPHSGPYQRVEDVKIEWDGTAEKIDSGSMDVIYLEGKTGGDGTVLAVITYSVFLKQGVIRWAGPDDPRYHSPQSEIESDAPEIADRADELKEKVPRETAFRIFSFTAHYLSWPTGTREGGDQSARTAYRSRVGGCGEFANLMTALARADGIPAKSVSGLMLPFWWPPFYSQTVRWGSPAGAHAWVEIYDGSEWTFADPSWASNLPWDGLWFGRTVGAHLVYGEKEDEAETYAGMMEWGKSHGEIIGAMSAPGKFVASAGDKTVTFVPSVAIHKGWDLRWILAAIAYGVILAAISVMERRMQPRRVPPPSAPPG
jgi:hypothetical protein